MSENSKPAFPRSGPGGDEGMSLRDFFAAAALQGIIHAMTNEAAAQVANEAADRQGITVHAAIALQAYKQADAMLAQREKL